jgi:RNA polymerase sigma-70 factor (ECF subfamily)
MDNPASGQANNEPTSEFLHLLLMHQRRIWAFIVTLLPNWADAEEVYQDTCLVMWSKWNEFEPGTNFLAWACKIAQNKILNRRRRRSRGQLALDEEVLEAVAQERLASDQVLDARYAALTDCLEKLRPNDQELIRQCYAGRETIKQVAQQLGRPADTLYKTLKRIRDALYNCVDRAIAREGRI